MRDYKPEYMAVCFDSRGKTLREQKFAQYKIQRPSMPEGLISQIPLIKDVMKAFRINLFESEGYEADDIIATLAKWASQSDMDAVIVSDDKDMFQLVNKNISMLSFRDGEMRGVEQLKKKLGYEPHRIVDFIGLAGDKADNIPGVMGIGEVTARKLINEFGDLEKILKNVKKIKPEKLQMKLEENKKEALLSKELAILDLEVPLEKDLELMKVQEPDNNRLFELFKNFEFRRLAEEFSVEEKTQESEITVEALKTKADREKFAAKARKNGRFAFLLEKEDDVVKNIALSVGDAKVYILAFEAAGELKTLWEDKDVVKVTHDFKQALKDLAECCVITREKSFDVLLGNYLVNSKQASSTPSDMAWEYFRRSVSQENRLAQETDVVYESYDVILRELKKNQMLDLFENMEMPLTFVLYQMQAHGVKIDVPFLKKMSVECAAKIDKLTTQLYEQAGEEFNVNSPKQLARILFEKLKLPVIKKTKTGFSTDEGVLSRLALEHDFPSVILEYRQLAKLKSTYIDALPKLIDPKTKKIHAEFNQIGAETGRLSSRNPNLQNIPIRTELGRQIRKAIITSEKDLIMISADYSQIELRVLAHLSGDKTLMKAFETDQDVHSYTASLIFDEDEKNIDYAMRDAAKRVNFGIVYGMSAFGLSKDLKVSQPEAQGFIDRYFARYPDVKKFMDECIKSCEKQGYVKTLLNRRRYIPEINSRNNGVKQFAQRQAINTPVQGSAADLIKLAMIDVQKELARKKMASKMLMTVHDELVFEGPVSEKQQLVTLIHACMENPIKLSVPIKISVKTGKNWLEMKEI